MGGNGKENRRREVSKRNQMVEKVCACGLCYVDFLHCSLLELFFELFRCQDKMLRTVSHVLMSSVYCQQAAH